ncbi:terminase small subunit [Salirhabdus sp. Marseille-P4669]|uniref:terminase small subunit n=1 Tax=Salirhabdus sp. Marseille-P4669 TaxID=2042310 RepID=UPI000C7A7EA3|nr:terminase small subunit [Salirhabdus sp. Marseille-P4669]
MDDLTPKQEVFVFEYLKDFNATQAAIRAGYRENSARITASRLLSNANIREEINEQRKKMAEELRHLFLYDAIVARQVMVDVLNDPEASNRDKITAAKDLLDRAGFAPIDKKELSGPDKRPIEIVFTPTEQSNE